MEMTRFPSYRGFSVRSILGFALAVLITALLWAILASPAAHAEDGSWHGDVVVLDGHSFSKATNLKDSSSTLDPSGTIYQSPVQKAGTQYNNSKDDKVFILYFAPGVDPPTATSATYYEFTYDAATKTLTNPAGKRDVSLTVKGKEDAASSCSVSGIGWIICPVSTFIAEGMDKLFDILKEMLTVKPLTINDTSSGMYTAWNIMRNIANIAFVIAFLVIIYAQITGGTFSNYTIKKLLPRLVVAAVLVNLSFVVSALAIDASNIAGVSIQQIFTNIGHDVFRVTNDDLGGFNTNAWGTVTAAVLAGGGIIGGVFYASSGGLWLLIPVLISVALTVLFVVVVFAARQAIIIILVIISPLAFVANLLPNTEKWFERWKDALVTMLIFFPAFSLVYGGSQLAGQIIIQNAGDNIVTLIFGLAVQIAPLVITPLILKFSGGILGKIAQIANNPNKGLIDRSRNWAGKRAEHAKRKNMALGPRLRNPASWGAGMVRGVDDLGNNLEAKTAAYKQKASNRYHANNKTYGKVHVMAHEFEVEKQDIETKQKEHIQALTNNSSHRLHLQNVKFEASKRALDATVKITEADIKEFNAGHIPAGASTELQNAITSMHGSQRSASIESMRAANADNHNQRELAEALKHSATLRTHAAGIKKNGEDSVLASAVSSVRRADAEDIKNIQDASDIGPGRLGDVSQELVAAIKSGNTVRAKAFQNMLVTAGGAGLDEFRKTITSLGTNIPVDVSDAMRDNMLSNHGGQKAKANDLIEWAAKGGILQSHTDNPKMWQGLSNSDFIGQHPKAQAHALNVHAFDHARAQQILADDITAGGILTEAIKAELRDIV